MSNTTIDVVTHHGKECRLNDLAEYMDDELREELHSAFVADDLPAQMWLECYEAAHLVQFGEAFNAADMVPSA